MFFVLRRHGHSCGVTQPEAWSVSLPNKASPRGWSPASPEAAAPTCPSVPMREAHPETCEPDSNPESSRRCMVSEADGTPRPWARRWEKRDPHFRGKPLTLTSRRAQCLDRSLRLPCAGWPGSGGSFPRPCSRVRSSGRSGVSGSPCPGAGRRWAAAAVAQWSRTTVAGGEVRSGRFWTSWKSARTCW